jgi:hypothetical protein
VSSGVVPEEVADGPDAHARENDVRLVPLLPDAAPAGRESAVHIEDRILETEGGGRAGHVRAGSTILV